MGKVKNLLPEEPVEGAACPIVDCHGQLVYLPVENCYCRVSPPCSYCVENPLTCNRCGEEFEP